MGEKVLSFQEFFHFLNPKTNKKGEMMSKNNNFFIEQYAKEFKVSEKNLVKILNKVIKLSKRQKVLTKNFLARTTIHYLHKIRQEEQEADKNLLLSNFKHKCLQKHYNKFIELINSGWGAKRIENYFKKDLNCGISKAYLDKVLKFLKEEKED